MKKFDSILDLYNFTVDLINKNIDNINQLSNNNKISFFRNNLDKNILNYYCTIGKISDNIADKFEVYSKIIKLSIDSLIKNIIEHPEISFKEYNHLCEYINNAEYILKKNNKNLIYFKIENKIYQFVIKKTKNNEELFITTFHKASVNQLNKDVKRYEIINKKDSSDCEDSKYPSVT